MCVYVRSSEYQNAITDMTQIDLRYQHTIIDYNS